MLCISRSREATTERLSPSPSQPDHHVGLYLKIPNKNFLPKACLVLLEEQVVPVSGVIADEQNQVFALTATVDNVSAEPKKPEGQPTTRTRQKKIPKNSASISVQTDWTWKDMEMLEKYRVKEPEPEESDSDVEPIESVSKVEEPPEQVESTTTSLPELPIVTSVGLPPILQYNPESKQKLDDLPRTDEEINEDELRELGVHVYGRVPCEFCGKELRIWPTIVEQETSPPSELFCCTEYREFVEAVLEMQKEENSRLDSKPIDIQPHAKVRSRRARQLAEERAKARLWERNAAEQKRLEEQVQEFANSTNPKAMGNSEQAKSYRGTSTVRTSSQLPSAKSDSAMAARMKTFTYQLSNLKYVEEGWTLKGPTDFEISSDEESDLEEHILIPRDISTVAFKKSERPLVQRFYKDGTTAAILFSTGTGSIYYPSGNLAVSISEVARAMLLYTAFTDEPSYASRQIAQFDPFGNGYCNFTSGNLRLQLTALEGIELNSDGSRRRRWHWWAKANSMTEPHIHAPPCQPILFHLNEEIAIKVCSQEKIYLRFSCELVDLKFKVGARLKVNNVNNLPSTQKSDPYDSYLKKKSTVLTRLLKNIHTEAQQYVKSQELIRSSQEPTRSVQESARTGHKTTVVSLSQQNRNKTPIKESLFPPIRQNEEKVQNNRRIYRSVVVT
ncbi:unnamed protein product [Adineta ricciae]|uniref:FAM194 C-terminal domain-containing protein n=1 Tax=Adineta ricciae TaxID=249248 RepID=A0A814PBF9_ADIRI|nr:unnamed protein product [Adineta ricciae]